MDTLKFVCNEFYNLPISVFEEWYDAKLGTLNIILDQLKSDLKGFEYQNGTNRIALMQMRVKSKPSFIDKIYKLRDDNATLKMFQSDKSKEYQVTDLVKDLIGARLVMFFDNDIDIPVNYFDVYPMYNIENVKVYQVIPQNSPLSNQRKKHLFKRLYSISENAKITEKSSAYESLHLIVKYNANYLAIRKSAAPGQTVTKDKSLDFNSLLADANKISAFPIEIQIRTILQHTWAQIEHNMNYSETKRKGVFAVLDALLLEDFKCHKSMLNAAEHHQTIMYERFWNNKRQPTTLKNEMLGIDERSKYYKTEDAEKLMDITSEIHSKPSQDVVAKLIALTENFDIEYNENSFKLTYPEHIETWGRQRLVLLLFTYLLQSQESGVANTAKNAISKKFKFNYFTDDKEHLAISIYEHIRFIDTYFRWAANTTDEERKFVSDPLVFYRCAGAYIATHEYRRAIHLLQEVIENNYFINHATDNRNGSILNKLHFMRRIGEYYFLSYIRENRSDRSELTKSYSVMAEALKCTEGPSNLEERKTELRRIVAQMIVTDFHRYMLSDNPNKNVFLAIMKEELRNLFYEYFDDDWAIKSGEAYAYQALAIVKFADNSCEDSRQFASDSYDIIKKKGANPVFIKSFELVKDAIKSCTTDDDRSK